MKNIQRTTRPDATAHRQFKPGDNPSRADVSRAETPSVATEGADRRSGYKDQEAKTRAQLSAELARQAREEGD
jgi:hypothetical protein